MGNRLAIAVAITLGVPGFALWLLVKATARDGHLLPLQSAWPFLLPAFVGYCFVRLLSWVFTPRDY